MAFIFAKTTSDRLTSAKHVNGDKHMTTEIWVGSGFADNTLLAVPSVTRTHYFNPDKNRYEIVFEYKLNGRPLAKKVYASNKQGRTRKLLSEGFAYIGKMKSRRIK